MPKRLALKPTKIIIVDDHHLFSNAVNVLIKGFKNFEVIKILGNGKEMVSYFENQGEVPEIMLMDIKMPLMDGIEATKWLRKHKPDVRVLALSMEAEENTVVKMLRAGAKGYLLKDIDPEVLEHSLNEVHKNGFYYTENVTNSLLKSKDPSNNIDAIFLKERELEFLKLACTEYTYREIAERMFLSPKTVENYREALFEKLNARSRIGLVLYAIKHEIVVL